MQTFLKPILILHENREKSKLFKQIYRLKLAFSHTSCIYFTELNLTFHLTRDVYLCPKNMTIYNIKN
jgi:hypothetical protein